MSRTMHYSGTNNRTFCGHQISDKTNTTAICLDTTCKNCLHRLFQCKDIPQELFNLAVKYRNELSRLQNRINKGDIK
jgi:hypothetical protein